MKKDSNIEFSFDTSIWAKGAPDFKFRDIAESAAQKAAELLHAHRMVAGVDMSPKTMREDDAEISELKDAIAEEIYEVMKQYVNTYINSFVDGKFSNITKNTL